MAEKINHGLPYLLAHAKRQREISAAKTHCKKGHEFTPENTIYRNDGSYRRCKKCFRATQTAYQRRKGWRRKDANEAQIREFIGHIAHGGTFADLMPNHRSSLQRRTKLSADIIKIKQTLRLSPKLYARLRKQSHQNYLKRLHDVVRAPAIIRRADPIEVLEALGRAVPREFPERDDIIQQAALAVYEGRSSLAAACRNWRNYRRKHERLFGMFAALSLETPIGEDGLTIGHTISQGFYANHEGNQ